MLHSSTQYYLASLLKQLGVTTLYALLIHTDHLYFESGTAVSSFEAASGFALAVLLLGGKRYVWGVFLGGTLANVATNPLGAAVTIASSHALEAFCGAWLLMRNYKFEKSLSDYLRLILMSGVVGAGVGANFGVMALLVFGFITPETFSHELIHWWTGDLLGVALTTPLILVFWQTKNDWLGTKRVAEAVLLLGLTFLAGQIIFLGWFYDSLGQVAKGYLMFLLITWVAVRLGTRGTVIAMNMVSIQGLLGAYRGVGYFANDIAQTQLANYWFYTLTLSMVGMALATFIATENRNQETLYEQEEFFRLISENIHDFIAVLDLDGRRLYNNTAYAKLFGDVKNIQGTDSFAEIHPDDRERIKRVFHETVQSGISQRTEYRFVLPDGSTCDMESHGKLIRGSQGQPSRVVVVSRDITERKAAKTALLRSETKFRALYDSTSDAVLLLDKNGFLDCNKAAMTLIGCATKEELCSKHPADLSPMEQPGGASSLILANQHIATAMEKGSHHFDWMCKRLDTGKNFLADVLLSAMELDGKPALQVVVRDITEHKQAEMALQESEERLRGIMNNASAIIFMKDTAGRYLLVNSLYEKLFHVSNASMQGKTDRDIFPQNMADALIKNDQSIVQSGQPLEVEEQVLQDDGIHTYISVKFPLRDSSGKIYAVCGIATDITERKAAEQQLRALSTHIQEAREEEKTNMAREIHDELGGTLTALKMDAYWLSRKLPVNKETAPHLERAKSMMQLIDNAVGVTRRIISDMRPTMLDDLGLLAAIEWQAVEFHKRSGIECRVSCIKNEGNLDKQRSIALFRIFQEALTNVSRHAGASKVEIEFHQSKEEVILAINDNGRGIPENNTATSKSYGILGMTERVAQLGGKIIFGSPPGSGFSVTVRLPLPAEEWSI